MHAYRKALLNVDEPLSSKPPVASFFAGLLELEVWNERLQNKKT